MDPKYSISLDLKNRECPICLMQKIYERPLIEMLPTFFHHDIYLLFSHDSKWLKLYRVGAILLIECLLFNSFCMLGNFACFLLSPDFFFQN